MSALPAAWRNRKTNSVPTRTPYWMPTSANLHPAAARMVGDVFVDLIRDPHRFNSHIVSAAYPILDEAGLLRETRIRGMSTPGTETAITAPVVFSGLGPSPARGLVHIPNPLTAHKAASEPNEGRSRQCGLVSDKEMDPTQTSEQQQGC